MRLPPENPIFQFTCNQDAALIHQVLLLSVNTNVMEKYMLFICIFSSGMVKHFSVIISKKVSSFLPSFLSSVLERGRRALCPRHLPRSCAPRCLSFFSFLILVVLAVFSYLAPSFCIWHSFSGLCLLFVHGIWLVRKCLGVH